MKRPDDSASWIVVISSVHRYLSYTAISLRMRKKVTLEIITVIEREKVVQLKWKATINPGIEIIDSMNEPKRLQIPLEYPFCIILRNHIQGLSP